jgi:hypothetical protein
MTRKRFEVTTTIMNRRGFKITRGPSQPRGGLKIAKGTSQLRARNKEEEGV